MRAAIFMSTLMLRPTDCFTTRFDTKSSSAASSQPASRQDEIHIDLKRNFMCDAPQMAHKQATDGILICKILRRAITTTNCKAQKVRKDDHRRRKICFAAARLDDASEFEQLLDQLCARRRAARLLNIGAVVREDVERDAGERKIGSVGESRERVEEKRDDFCR